MNYYKLRTTTENKVWKKYFVIDECFLNNENTVKFHNIYNKQNILKNLYIRALDSKGFVVYDEREFSKTTAPYFCSVESIILINDTVFQNDLFDDIKGVNFLPLEIRGSYTSSYKLMQCANITSDCIDEEKSIRKDFTFLSKLILKESEIPKHIDAFFLSGWDKYSQFEVIVNERMKERLSKLNHSSEFLIFDRLELSAASDT
ncbi:hypothetical protein [Prevotella sp. HUN102]|uniref:hypothetical protein n=1 Tax=Prevotella sp. HUN102 TaxID=1392486 RepID=UPI00049168CA|nr:hypothetical protein [Prevotella sp. HUN102]